MLFLISFHKSADNKFSFSFKKFNYIQKIVKTKSVVNITDGQFIDDDKNTVRVYKASEIVMEKNFLRGESLSVDKQQIRERTQ